MARSGQHRPGKKRPAGTPHARGTRRGLNARVPSLPLLRQGGLYPASAAYVDAADGLMWRRRVNEAWYVADICGCLCLFNFAGYGFRYVGNRTLKLVGEVEGASEEESE